jgi:hypothetical protein
LLGIGPRSAGNPRAIARLAAGERAGELADALLAPLDDRTLGTLERQRAAVVVLGETFPLQRETVELSVPATAGDIDAMSWSDMRELAGRLAAGEL